MSVTLGVYSLFSLHRLGKSLMACLRTWKVSNNKLLSYYSFLLHLYFVKFNVCSYSHIKYCFFKGRCPFYLFFYVHDSFLWMLLVKNLQISKTFFSFLFNIFLFKYDRHQTIHSLIDPTTVFSGNHQPLPDL